MILFNMIIRVRFPDTTIDEIEITNNDKVANIK